MDEVLKEVREFVAGRVADGFYNEADLVDSATRYLGEEHGRADLRPQVQRLTQDLLLEHYRAQTRWGWPTLRDRDEPPAERVAVGYVYFEVLQTGEVRACGELIVRPGTDPALADAGRRFVEALGVPFSRSTERSADSAGSTPALLSEERLNEVVDVDATPPAEPPFHLELIDPVN
jgi:hypothetical protein